MMETFFAVKAKPKQREVLSGDMRNKTKGYVAE